MVQIHKTKKRIKAVEVKGPLQTLATEKILFTC